MLSNTVKTIKDRFKNGKNGVREAANILNPLLDKLNDVINEFVQKSKETQRIIKDNGKDKNNPDSFQI